MLLKQAALLSKKSIKGFHIKCKTPAYAFSSLMSCCTTSKMVQTYTVQNFFFFACFKLEQAVPGLQCTAGHSQHHSHSPQHAPKHSVALLFHENIMGQRAAFPYRGVQYVAILTSLRTAMFSSIIMSS